MNSILPRDKIKNVTHVEIGIDNMDSLRLLSRSTKLSRGSKQRQTRSTPSSGRNALPHSFVEHENDQATISKIPRKRKRGQDDLLKTRNDELSFSSVGHEGALAEARPPQYVNETEDGADGSASQDEGQPGGMQLSLEERNRVLKQHKLKVTWLNPPPPPKQDRQKDKVKSNKAKKARSALYPRPVQRFDVLQTRFGVSSSLASNIASQGFSIPTEVQLGALPLLLDIVVQDLSESSIVTNNGIDLLTVAPTGSGKTLAFMIPLIHDLESRRRAAPDADRGISAIILAPTKELTGQIVNEGRKLAKGTGVKVSQLRKGTRLGHENSAPQAYGDNGKNGDIRDEHGPVVKADIVVSTPGLLQSAISDSSSTLSQVRHLIFDEADVLLDPLFREQTLGIWSSLTSPKLRVSMWSATMGSNIEELARSTIDKRGQRLMTESGFELVAAPLIRLVVGLKDSAVPNVEHRLIYAATEQGKLMGLRQLLHPTSSIESSPPLRPPFLVFTQTIERAVALHSELLYDIPAEAGGIARIAVLHADLSDTKRDSVMTRFRKGEIWVVITTDLLSRGVDFRGMNGVVNYDIPTSSAAYVHRVGRTGRAGREGGVAVTLYNKEDIPYLKHVANVMSMAQKQNGEVSGTQQWLLDALPTLSKNQRQSLKKHGVESRTTRGKEKDPKAARQARISTKAGFVRRTENRRKGAITGSQKRAQMDMNSDAGGETDFGGFD